MIMFAFEEKGSGECIAGDPKGASILLELLNHSILKSRPDADMTACNVP